MKSIAHFIGMLYVLVSVFIGTDLNPLLYWDWYRDSVNSLFNFMYSIHHGLPFLWIISVVVIASIVVDEHKIDEKVEAFKRKTSP